MEDISIILWDQNWAVWPQDQMLCLVKSPGNSCCMHSFSNLRHRSLNFLQRSLCVLLDLFVSPLLVTQFLRTVCSTHINTCAIFLPPLNYGFYCTPRYTRGLENASIHQLVFLCLHGLVYGLDTNTSSVTGRSRYRCFLLNLRFFININYSVEMLFSVIFLEKVSHYIRYFM